MAWRVYCRALTYIYPNMVTIQLVTNRAELTGILSLQQANLRKNITQQEAESQGFLIPWIMAESAGILCCGIGIKKLIKAGDIS